MHNQIEIRPLMESDIQDLEKKLTMVYPTSTEFSNLDARLHSVIPQKGDILETYIKIQKKEEICLIAWDHEIPVGWMHLRWLGDHDLERIALTVPRAAEFVNMPAIYDFWIKHEYRSNGIGRKMVQMAEKYARLKKFSRIGLVVDSFNKPAFNFYISLRFQDSGLDDFETSGSYEKDGEQIEFHHGPMRYLYTQL